MSNHGGIKSMTVNYHGCDSATATREGNHVWIIGHKGQSLFDQEFPTKREATEFFSKLTPAGRREFAYA